ncbi:hypothetical protein GPUN_0738 [Glaciecola punicea ACAM 611]|uniref:Uncharacterized protein n=1 Tax=Glaciecola punicea ACAM 611 TaxID=1121923 RepID=H5T999_9ALTE|nr:hypothetical protein GPUN_0738 [Glaciecola punicea ACAM 611]
MIVSTFINLFALLYFKTACFDICIEARAQIKPILKFMFLLLKLNFLA